MNYYYKSIIYELNNTPSFIKVYINDNIVTSSNDKISNIIQSKINKLNKINNIQFYISLYDFQLLDSNYYWDTIKDLDRNNLPILRPNDDIYEFINWLNNNFNKVKTYETLKFIKKEYIYDDPEKCKENILWEQTNSKFKKFNQLLYHAGDKEDLERYGFLYIRTMFSEIKNIKIENNIWFNANKQLEIWNKFNTDFQSIRNTMKYLFNKMKKGVLVGIKNNKLIIFLPFSKHNYRNDFYTELYFDDRDKKMLLEYQKTKNKNILKQLENTVKHYFYKYKLRLNDVHLDRRKWVANDCFFRYENYEGDKTINTMENMFVELCKNRELPDSIFFLNLRDHPVLHKELKDSYTSIIDKDLDDKYKFNKYAPILSVGPSTEHADIPLVTQDDWLRISKKYYLDECKNGYINDVNIPEWNDKINKAVFRGSATGCSYDEQNIRIKASIISNQYPELLDAGIITFNRKLKKQLNKPLNIINIPNYKTTNFMTLNDKAKHKYILNLDGHVAAFRLGHEFSLKSVILIPKSKYYLWFSHLLEPFVHYVPVESDLSNLIDMIKWCINNDDKCKEIALNGYNFYNKYLTKDGIYDYMQYVLTRLQFNKLNIPKYKPSIALITVYRNNVDNSRLYQKRLFVFWLNKMLSQICSNYRIIVVEQQKDNYFNIGKLKNIGYHYLKSKGEYYDNYIFSDIDTIPDSRLIKYYFKITDSLNSLATSGSRWSTDKIPFAGALVSCTGSIFEELNGYPNNFINWGDEDTCLLLRLSELNKAIYENKKGSIIDIEESNMRKKTIVEKLEELKKNKISEKISVDTYEKIVNFKSHKNSGLLTLTYNILYEYEYKNNYHIIVDLDLEKDKKLYPNHYNFSKQVTKEEYKKFKYGILNKIKRIPF